MMSTVKQSWLPMQKCVHRFSHLKKEFEIDTIRASKDNLPHSSFRKAPRLCFNCNTTASYFKNNQDKETIRKLQI